MNVPTVQYARTPDGVGVAYSVHGSGPALLYVRGWSHLEYEWQIRESREWLERLGRSFTVVRFDPRGQGMSRHAGQAGEKIEIDAASILDAAGLATASFLGTGGGYQGADAAAGIANRVTAAVLWSPAPSMGGVAVPEVYRHLLAIREVDPDLFLETLHMWQGWEEPDSRAARTEMRRRSGLEDFMYDSLGGADERATRGLAQLSESDLPILLVGREGVRFHTTAALDALAGRLRNAQRRTLSGSGLFPELGDIEEAARVVEDFLLPHAEPPPQQSLDDLPSRTEIRGSQVLGDQQPSIRYVASADGVRVPYWTLGSGPTLLLLSLPATSHLELEWALDGVRHTYLELAQRFTVVRCDLRNSGLATRGVERYDLDAMADDVEAILAQLEPPAFILGMHHMGKVAVTVANRHPELVRRLIFVEAPLGSVFGGDAYRGLELLAPLAAKNYPLYCQLTSVAFHGLADPEFTRQVSEFAERAMTGEDFDRSFAWLTSSVRSGLGALQCPVQIIHDSRMVGTENILEAVDLIPDARIATVSADQNLRFLAPEVVPPIVEFLTDAAGRPHQRSLGGFATILFTDVVASTPLLTRLRDERMREVMHQHDAVCNTAISEHGGRVVKTIGDAFMAEFSVPSAAIDAAIDIQRGIRRQFSDSDVPVRVRIGINAGEPIAEGDDLHGASVVIAKRLESAADASGILVSDVVRQVVTGKDFEFADRGRVPLKGFDQPMQAWAVRWDA